MKKEITNKILRVVAAGSVDDGKSTLIGRLFYDCDKIYQDQLEAIKQICLKKGIELDLSLLTDGLMAEREQNITIDVAYIHFSTEKRNYIIADVPGHKQYTQNMITGTSTADVALILIDAKKGMTAQTRRHLFLTSLIGVPHVLFVINKMDLVDYKEEVFNSIKSEIIGYAGKLNLHDLQFIPVSAQKGDMVVNRGMKLGWYKGHTLLDYLENLQTEEDRNLKDFRFPIQSVISSENFRGYAGMIESGTIELGAEVVILPSGVQTKIKSIMLGEKELPYAFSPQSVTMTLNDEVDASRGDMIVKKNNIPEKGETLEATLCWMSENALEIGQEYTIKHTTRTCKCRVEKIFYKIDIDSLYQSETDSLQNNEIGKVVIRTQEPLFFDPYEQNHNTGNFALFDIVNNETVGAGIILNKLKSSKNR